MSYPYNTLSDTPEKYRFTIISSRGPEKLKYPPLEWESGILEFDRNLFSGGVFNKFNIESLTFVKDGAYILQSLWDESETMAVAKLKVERFKDSILDYVAFPNEYAFDFNQFKTVKVEGFAFGKNISVKRPGIITKIENRKSKNVDITKLESIESFSIVDYEDLKTSIKIPDFYAYFYSRWVSLSKDTYLEDIEYPVYTLRADRLVGSDFPNQSHEVAGKLPPIKDNAIFYESDETRTVMVNISFDTKVGAISGVADIKVYAYIYDEIGGLDSIVELLSRDNQPANREETLTLSEPLTINQGYSIAIAIRFYKIVSIEISNVSTEFKLDVLKFTTKYVQGYPIYEAFERICQLILDKQYPIYSEFLGRSDNEYNPDGDTYGSESQLRFASITTGVGLRGLDITDDSNSFAISFETMFKTLQCLYNIGYGPEIIDGDEIIRIEAWSHFFCDVEILDLSARVGKYDIENRVLTDACYSSLFSGFENFEYDSVNGRGEFNTKMERTTILNTENQFDNISKVRGDTAGIILAVDEPVSDTGTKDSKSDKDMFILKCQRDVDGWVVEKDENVTIYGDSSLFGDGSMNLYFSPMRNLIRNASRWAIGLQKQLSSYIRFQTSGKLATLKTTGEGYTVTENENIQVGDSRIPKPFLKPIVHVFESSVTWEDIDLISAIGEDGIPNIYKRVTVGAITGWILNMKKKNNEDKAIFEIIEKLT